MEDHCILFTDKFLLESSMKIITSIVLSAVAMMFLSTAQAQPHGRWHNQEQRHPEQRPGGYPDRHQDRHPQRPGGHQRLWSQALAGAVIAGVVGGVIYRAQSATYNPPGHVLQSVPYPTQTSFYCAAYNAYYPAVTVCPGNWQVIQQAVQYP